MTTKPKAILFRLGGLGDLLVALPAAALVRRNLPDFRLTLLGRPEYAALLRHAGIVDEVIAFDDPRLTTPVAHGGAVLAGFDLTLGWLNRGGEWPTKDWLTRQGSGLAFFTSYDSNSAMPMSRFFFERTNTFLSEYETKRRTSATASREESAGELRRNRKEPERLDRRETSGIGWTELDALFVDCARLALPAQLREKAIDALGLPALGQDEKRLVVHPGSGGRAKRWPLCNFIEVIRSAASLGVPGVLVTGEAEADYETTLKGIDLPGGWTRASRLPTETLAGLLAESTHYLGNDSGPTHLAAACGVRVLVLFREENLPAWRPFGRTRVLTAPAIDQIPANAVLAGLGDFLAR
jgi:hypothetical protein